MKVTHEKNSIKALSSLALMETNLIEDDYISSYIPFIATLIEKHSYKTIEIEVIVSDFQKEFGIAIPSSPMTSILSRAVNSKIISRESNGTFVPVKTAVAQTSFSLNRDSSNAKIDMLVDLFVNYTKSVHNKDIEKDDGIEMLMNFFDEFSPTAISGRNIDVLVEEMSQSELYLVGDFIDFLSKKDPENFEKFRKLALSYLITSALVFDEKTERREIEFSNMTIFLDTPIILRLLGLQTPELEQSYLELFTTLDTLISPEYKLFQHTLDEINGILNDCIHWIGDSNYNPTLANPALISFIAKNFNKTMIEVYKDRLLEKLKEFNITLDDMQAYELHSNRYQIDSKKLETILVETYSERRPSTKFTQNNTSIQYDIKSVECIIKLWRDKTSRSYNKLGYVFLTSNATLAYVSRKFIKDYSWNERNHKSPCITDYFLGTMLWLSTPFDKIDNYVKLKLLADCSAATEISKELMQKFVIELDRLKEMGAIDNSQFLLARKSAFEKNYLQKRTLNDETAFKVATINEIIEDIQEEIKKPLYKELEQKNENFAQLSEIHEKARETIQKYESKESIEANAKKEQHEKLEQNSKKIIDRLINLIFPVCFALASFGFILLGTKTSDDNFNDFLRIFSGSISVLSALLLGCLKTNLLSIRTRLANFILKQLYFRDYKKKIKLQL